MSMKLNKSFAILLVTSLFTVSAFAKTKLDAKALSKYGTAFRDEAGTTTVEIATLTKKNKDGLYDALVKITGPGAEKEGIDGKVEFLKAVHAGTGYNLQYEKDGEARNRLSSRTQWGSWENVEIYLDSKTIKLYVDQSATKEVRPLHLLTEYQK
jgi:hypothetical protein